MMTTLATGRALIVEGVDDGDDAGEGVALDLDQASLVMVAISAGAA